MSARLRPARSTDAGKTGDIIWRFTHETAWLPRLFSNAEMIAFCGQMIDRGWVTVALLEDKVQGFIARNGEEINALYIARAASRRGLGRMLLEDAKSRAPRLILASFQANASARQFYLREGFVEAGKGDGADNDERLPDMRFVWPGKGAKT